MENLQRVSPKNQVTKSPIRPNTTLSGPMTWILLLIIVATLFGTVKTLASNSPAAALRTFFNHCFEGRYESAWNMVKTGSPYQELKKDLKNFSEGWERSKSHGTDYVNIKIEQVVINQTSVKKGTPMVSILYCIMQYDEQEREKEKDNPSAGKVKVKILQDSYRGEMFMEFIEGSWKMVKAGR